MGPLPLLRAEDSLLLIVDMQARAAAALPPTAWARARANTTALARAAGALSLPVIATRLTPTECGRIEPEIAQALPAWTDTIDRTCFAATDADRVREALAMAERSQVVVCGMQTHLAVVQTVAGLAARGHRPFVAADGVGARDQADHESALARMRSAAIPLIARESVLAEWLGDPSHPAFEPSPAPAR